MRETSRKIPLLSVRETSVLKLASEGCTNKYIGILLFISELTVKRHMSSILEKLEANDRAHAVALAIGRGIIGPIIQKGENRWRQDYPSTEPGT